MDSIKKALNKGFDKATNVNNEPQVLNKSSSQTGTGTDHHLEKKQPHHDDPRRSAGAAGAATGMGDRRASMSNQSRYFPHDTTGYAAGPPHPLGLHRGGTAAGPPPLGSGFHSTSRGSRGSVASTTSTGTTSSSSSGGEPSSSELASGLVSGLGEQMGIGTGMQSHGRYEHRQPSLQEQKRGERMGWDIGEHFDV
ncbi:hypothetical protein QBC45DRAFT_471068 [Copromyces sp. CBS 386.78]|nr:hypothetical protein QBC45DRAFT_471068 [Copromyces sp. CBS 386.78]